MNKSIAKNKLFGDTVLSDSPFFASRKQLCPDILHLPCLHSKKKKKKFDLLCVLIFIPLEMTQCYQDLFFSQ